MQMRQPTKGSGSDDAGQGGSIAVLRNKNHNAKAKKGEKNNGIIINSQIMPPKCK